MSLLPLGHIRTGARRIASVVTSRRDRLVGVYRSTDGDGASQIAGYVLEDLLDVIRRH
jgi:hypothetical protein